MTFKINKPSKVV